MCIRYCYVYLRPWPQKCWLNVSPELDIIFLPHLVSAKFRFVAAYLHETSSLFACNEVSVSLMANYNITQADIKVNNTDNKTHLKIPSIVQFFCIYVASYETAI